MRGCPSIKLLWFCRWFIGKNDTRNVKIIFKICCGVAISI